MTNNELQPSFHILICLIQIWKGDPKKPMEVPDKMMMITEVESIQIEESYKKLIGTASVKFPRGTVIRKTIDKFNEEEAAKDKSLHPRMASTGVVEELRNSTSVATVDSFNVDDRIRIYLGYTTDPELAKLAKTNHNGKNIWNDSATFTRYKDSLHKMFDGYITKISVDTPIELHCENLASQLKNITCKKISVPSKSTVNDFFSANGKYKMFEGTGFKLYPPTESWQFALGGVELTTDLTVADVLTEWEKYGLHCFLKEYNGEPTIAIGRSYFTNATSNTDSVIGIEGQSAKPVPILFDYNVANNNLTLTSTDKKFLAVEAEGLGADGKFFHVTLLKNPQYDESKEGSTPWRVVNESNLSRKALKLGIRALSKSKDRVSMNLYTTIPYHSRKIPITREELMEEAIKYYESYNMNGIDGSLELFGDLNMHTATKVELIDNRYPGKNGIYLVDEVNTTFGTGGYRQEIKLPYCISRAKQEDNGSKTETQK